MTWPNKLPESLERLLAEEDEMQVMCTRCGLPVKFPDLQQPQIMNTPGASLVLVEHPQTSFCLTCKTKVAIMLQGANLHFLAAPVVEEKKSPIVIAPAGVLKNPEKR